MTQWPGDGSLMSACMGCFEAWGQTLAVRVGGHGLHHGGLAWELLWVVGDVGRIRCGSHQRWARSSGDGLHH